MLREKFKWRSHENESTDAKHRGRTKRRLGKAKIGRVARWVRDQYEVNGRITAISDEDEKLK
jgi:hypothetical protein